jgi:hypothetical protein
MIVCLCLDTIGNQAIVLARRIGPSLFGRFGSSCGVTNLFPISTPQKAAKA